MGGPAYDYDRRNTSRTKWPAEFDGLPLFYEWTRDYVQEFTLGADNEVTAIREVLPSVIFDNPMDLEFGPDGALYVLEYGDGYFAENPDAQLARIDFVRGNRTPIPKVTATPTSGQAPLTVSFSSAGTTAWTEIHCGTRGTSTRTARWTRVSPTRRTRSPRTATTAPP